MSIRINVTVTGMHAQGDKCQAIAPPQYHMLSAACIRRGCLFGFLHIHILSCSLTQTGQTLIAMLAVFFTTHAPIYQMRIEQAADVFLVAMRPDDPSGAVVGFVCGTRTAAPALTHASMSTHDPEGPLLCVHSVVVDPGLRRKGLARKMLRAYLRLDVPMARPCSPHAPSY